MVVGQPSHSSSGRLSAVPAPPPSLAPPRCPSEECDGYPEPTHRALGSCPPPPIRLGVLAAVRGPAPRPHPNAPRCRLDGVRRCSRTSVSGFWGACPPHPLFSARAVLFTVRRREVIPQVAKPSSRPAMLTPPDPPDRPGCTPRHAVHGSALNLDDSLGPQWRTVGPSTGAAVLPKRRSIRWSNITSRPSSHRPPRRTPWGAVSPHGSSATSGPTCAVAFSLMDSHEHGASVVATTFWWRSPAGAGEHVRRCNARRMVETAAHLVDRVLPPLPVRQWVLSVPKRIRPFLHHNPAIAGAVLRIFLRAIRTTLRQVSPGASPGAHIGAVSFLHRFGSSLNAHFHFHVCVIDGVLGEDPEGSVQFHEATHLTASDWGKLQHTVRHRVLRTTLRAVPSTATACSNGTSPMTCSRGKPPAGSVSMPRSTSRPVIVLGSNDSCATVPVPPSPSNGSRLPGTVRLEASASSIVFPIPHRMVAPLSRSPPSSSSSDSPYSFTRHASTATAITASWLPMQSSGIRSSRSGVIRVRLRSRP